MVIEVLVKFGKENKIIEENGKLIVYLKSKPIKNKANEELIEILAKYFKTKKRNIKIIKGLKSRNKLLDISI